MEYLSLFGRAWVLVTLTAFNMISIAERRYLRAAVGGFLISFVWLLNAHSASITDDLMVSAAIYGAGAALGTVSGMYLAGGSGFMSHHRVGTVRANVPKS